MPSYKLVYFDARGRAETSRMMFAQAGVEFEDCRVSGEEFGAMKGDIEKLPLGQLPVLKVDDITIPQSKAMERYIAREFGLYGKNANQSAAIDVICETVSDLFKEMIKMFFEKDEEAKKKMGMEFATVKSVPMCNFFVRCLEKNSQGKGFFVGDSMTYADIDVYVVFEGLEKSAPEMMAKYPVILSFLERMRKEEKIAAYLAKRPQTEF